MRCDYLMATLNPDDPNLPVYKEYINCPSSAGVGERDAAGNQRRTKRRTEARMGALVLLFLS